jgi:hypothetical protein
MYKSANINRFCSVILILLVSLPVWLQAAPRPLSATAAADISATEEQKEAYKDVEAITELREQIRNDERFYKLTGSAPYLELDKHEAFLKNIIDVEENVIPEANQQLDAWAETYGATGVEQKAAFEKVYTGLPIQAGSLDPSWGTSVFGDHYASIKDKFSAVTKTREACADELLTGVNSAISNMDVYPADYRALIYENALKALDLTLMYDPENSQAKDFIKQIENDSKAGLEARDKQIDAGRWPGQFENFAGPGSIDDLSEAALEWFKKDTGSKGWAESNPLLVAVKGDWVSAKKNILGETIQWGLPIYLAVHQEDGTDIVRVFSLTIITREELGIEKEPPFTGAWVGNNFDMRLGDLPSSSSSSSGPFVLWRVLLSVALLALGTVAAASALSALNPVVKKLVDKLLPHKALIGAFAALIGFLFFIKNLLVLAPFSDILPQLLAVITGIIFGAQFFQEKTKTVNTPEQLTGAANKANELLDNNREKLEKLRAYQVPLGFACLAAGILHLITGGSAIL